TAVAQLCDVGRDRRLVRPFLCSALAASPRLWCREPRVCLRAEDIKALCSMRFQGIGERPDVLRSGLGARRLAKIKHASQRDLQAGNRWLSCKRVTCSAHWNSSQLSGKDSNRHLAPANDQPREQAQRLRRCLIAVTATKLLGRRQDCA